MTKDTILYDALAAQYNSTRYADPNITERIIKLLSPDKQYHYVDIGCGTGNYTINLMEHGINMIGIEPSDQMLLVAKTRASNVTWLSGRSDSIPLGDGSVNGAIATLTMHHWSNLSKSFQELSRILTPESKIVVFTSTPAQMSGYWLNEYFPKMLSRSINKMPALEHIEEAASRAGLRLTMTEKFFVTKNTTDLFLYAGKHKPEIYFDRNVRNGISSFSAMASHEEMIDGLWELHLDLYTNSFESIRSAYENNLGDYLFVVLEK